MLKVDNKDISATSIDELVMSLLLTLYKNNSEKYLKPTRTFMLELSANIVNG